MKRAISEVGNCLAKLAAACGAVCSYQMGSCQQFRVCAHDDASSGEFKRLHWLATCVIEICEIEQTAQLHGFFSELLSECTNTLDCQLVFARGESMQRDRRAILDRAQI